MSDAVLLVKTCRTLVILLALGSSTGAFGQGTGNIGPGLIAASGVRGTAGGRTGVKTGQGPLTQPIPPATSTANPPQNPQRPSGVRGPAQTNPSSYPFGTR